MYFDLAFGGLVFLWSVWSEFFAVSGSRSRFWLGRRTLEEEEEHSL